MAHVPGHIDDTARRPGETEEQYRSRLARRNQSRRTGYMTNTMPATSNVGATGTPSYRPDIQQAIQNAKNAERRAAAATQPRGPVAPGTGISGAYDALYRNADERRLAARTDYLMKLAPMQERIRQARVAGAEGLTDIGNVIARSSIGGFGGISEAAKQNVLDTARASEAGISLEKKALRSEYISDLLGIDKELADKVVAEAIRRAGVAAGKTKAAILREIEQATGNIVKDED